jgi:sterol desaturase/sphingolipid hydroxylase (fatty acid hydroxylase superfamily)
MKYLTIRWLSYPVIMVAIGIGITYAIATGLSYWPWVPALALLGIACVAVLERIQPYERAWLVDHNDSRTDRIHFVVNATVLFVSIELLSVLRSLAATGSAWPLSWPVWVQIPIAMIIIDFGLFFMHWLSHRHEYLWRFHEAHHSSMRLYWLNGERRHPLHAVMMASPGLLFILLAGAPPNIIAAGLAILSVHLAFQHANLDYSVGIFRHALGVAETHRWHHKKEYEDAQVNFGEMLMIWDHLFGTYHSPVRRLGFDEIGVHDPNAPATYQGQLLRPFIRPHAARDAM